MTPAKMIVMYPQPTDLETFEHRYANEHLPMVVAKLVGKTRFVASLITGSAGGVTVPFHRMAEIYFPSMQALENCLHSVGGQETLEHSVEISTGGVPVFLMAEVRSLDF
ncbi:MAG: ethyl tert-butyl ether degradation EthD [Methylococcaceae bacterium NSP1-2]|nr:EthD family reductase [Methylococcaceae bacterium]OYV21128.1 MAG: ethyl tert-butyl ether degradation EthD [Methylococcaceae bacterium NSP1-2]